ncbi:MAG: NADH-quinone oxidoreductase subunit L [Dehalococcoidia bacterium]|nr:NADH-quinone oxidoreductase subunit L [Dehalococcoidia bacterium]
MVTLAFFFLATAAMIGALAVVTARNLFYAALGLLVSLAAVAGIYVTLDADFLALAQFLIYVGGIAVLIVFAVMMTAQINRASSSHRLWPLGLLTGAATLAGLAYVMINTEWRSESRGETISPMVGDASSAGIHLPDLLFSTYLLPFELAGLLLLVATIGALVIARER